MNRPLLKQSLDRLAADYGAVYLDSDPVGIVHRYSAPADIEVAGFIASALGYGGASQIRRSACEALDRTGTSPAGFAAETGIKDALELFRGFRHRWTGGADIAFLFLAAGKIIREYGSIGEFVKTLDNPAEETVTGVLTRFAEWIRARRDEFEREAGIPARSRFPVPSPADGSACKRPAMYFRWMVRGPDGVDFGLWKFIDPSRLVIPVDRHIARMAALLGLTGRKTPDWRMALEITRALRELDPGDPLRYDFALVRPGILRSCTAGATGDRGSCALGAVCRETSCV